MVSYPRECLLHRDNIDNSESCLAMSRKNGSFAQQEYIDSCAVRGSMVAYDHCYAQSWSLGFNVTRTTL